MNTGAIMLKKGYEPNELPDCSTPHNHHIDQYSRGQTHALLTLSCHDHFRHE